MPKREKTDSITHLVKIVAKEVISEALAEGFGDVDWKELCSMFNKASEFEKRISALERNTTSFSITNKLQNRGSMWNDYEDDMLIDAVNAAITVIAAEHGRTPYAIKRRLQDKGLIKCT